MSAQDASLAQPFDCALAATSKTVERRDEPRRDVDADARGRPAARRRRRSRRPPRRPCRRRRRPTTPPIPQPKTAKLTATLGGVPSTIKRNHTITLTLKLGNEGSKSTSAVTVSLAKPRGVSIARTKMKVSKFKPAQHRTLKLKLKLTAKAKKATTFKVTARSRQAQGDQLGAADDRQGQEGADEDGAARHEVVEPDRRHVLVADGQPRRPRLGQPRAVLRRRSHGLQRHAQGRPAGHLHDAAGATGERDRRAGRLPAVHLRRRSRAR